MLVSPAEPVSLRALGQVSSIPESLGVDFLLAVKEHGLLGIQRKEIGDLIASCSDGRLGREIEQGCTGKLYAAVLLIEGRLKWSSEGVLIGHDHGPAFTRRAYRNLMHSVQDRGWWVMTSDDIHDTMEYLETLRTWSEKGKHDSLDRRVTRRGWGTPVSIGRSMLQGVPGVGPDRARKIEDHFHGVPLAWTVDGDAMAEVPGIGRKTAEKLMKLFG